MFVSVRAWFTSVGKYYIVCFIYKPAFGSIYQFITYTHNRKTSKPQLSAMNNKKFMKCEKLSIKSNNSLKCSECHKMIHFKCSRLRVNKDFVQFKKSKQQFVCQFCSDYTCLKCYKHVYYDQKGVLCSIYNLWVHQKCDGLTNLQYKALGNNSEEPCYCRICKSRICCLSII